MSDTDPSHYFGQTADIHLEKSTNGEDADDPTGPIVAVGSTVTWTYVVTNPGNVELSDVTVTDNPAQTITATLTLSDSSAGVLTTSSSATFTPATGVWTISDSLAEQTERCLQNIEAALTEQGPAPLKKNVHRLFSNMTSRLTAS